MEVQIPFFIKASFSLLFFSCKDRKCLRWFGDKLSLVCKQQTCIIPGNKPSKTDEWRAIKITSAETGMLIDVSVTQFINLNPNFSNLISEIF